MDRVEALNRALLAGNSATEVLMRWCADAGCAEPVVAVPTEGEGAAPDAITCAILDGADWRLRQVRLCCGALVLSEAGNWYVPARLTPDMNMALETSDVPFGRVVAELGCTRRTIAAKILPSGGTFAIEHRAALLGRDGAAVCVVRERYTRAAVDALPPASLSRSPLR